MAVASGVKLLPPPKYEGNSDFDRFAKLMYAYLGCESQDYVNMMERAEEEVLPITQQYLDVAAIAHQHA